MDLRLPDIPHLRLRFELEAEAEARLPPFKGSLLRGAFGHALRRTACSVPGEDCATCVLRSGCAHPRLFEPFAGVDPPPYLLGRPAAPRPFVFEPWDERRVFALGERLGFDLVLFGAAVEFQGLAVMAAERMARTGLGVRRHRFRLRRVRSLDAEGRWRPGFEAGQRPWTQVPPIGLGAQGRLDGERLCLRFVTPLRLKRRGRTLRRFDFPTLAFRMLRRVWEVAHFHVPGARLDASSEPWMDLANRVEVVAEDLRWRDLHRYSNRQRRKVPLGGVVGRMELAGPLAPLHPLLRAAELLHVGKGTAFGLGWVTMVRRTMRG